MERYEVVRAVGKGSFGKVYLVKHRLERKRYCLKTVKLDGMPPAERRACQMEVRLLEKMTHPNIVGFKESFLARGGKLLCIVMTYCDGGDLAERLQQNRGRLFKEDQVLHWFVQLALGLHHMHEMNDKCILHRDLKTQNIFLLGNGRLVIGDLGISKALDNSTDFTKTTIGTPYYMSPEVYRSCPYNHKADIWALGCVLYEMTTLKHAFNAKSLNGLMGKVVKGRFAPIPRTFSRNLAGLVDRMLSLDPAARPSLPEILSQPFVKRHVFRLLRDIAERPTAQIGDGTMVLRRAALGAVSGAHNQGVVARSDPLLERQTASLKRQLESLGMTDLVRKAFEGTSAASPTPSPRRWPAKENSVAPGNSPAPKPQQLRRAAKEQRKALVLERERKRAVESALAKLRAERELRAQERARRQRRLESERRRQAESKAREERHRREAQRKASERIREYNSRAANRGRLDRLRERNPRLVAQRKARQFEKQYQEDRRRQPRQEEAKVASPHHEDLVVTPSFAWGPQSPPQPTSPPLRRQQPPPPAPQQHQQHQQQQRKPSSPPSPPPPPPPPPPVPAPQSQHARMSPPGSHRAKMLALKEERKRSAEQVQKERLMQAAHERMHELRAASELNRKQFHGTRAAGDVADDNDDYSEHRHTPRQGYGGDAGLQQRQQQQQQQQPGEDADEGEDEILSDDSSVPEVMPALDSEDDDLDEEENQLKLELEAATVRCSTIKQMLSGFRAVLQDDKQPGSKPSAGPGEVDEGDEDDEEEEADISWSSDEVSPPASPPPSISPPPPPPPPPLQSSRLAVRRAWAGASPRQAQPAPSYLVKQGGEPGGDDGDDASSTGSSSSSSSSDNGLFSPVVEGESEVGGFAVAHRGGLKSRIHKLEEECVRALGARRFHQAYALLREQLERKLAAQPDAAADRALQEQMHALLVGDGKLAYWSKIDNLIFMQEAV